VLGAAQAEGSRNRLQWGEEQIRASRLAHYAPGALPDLPSFKSDPLDLDA